MNELKKKKLVCVRSSFERSCYFSKFYMSRVISSPRQSMNEPCRPVGVKKYFNTEQDYARIKFIEVSRSSLLN